MEGMFILVILVVAGAGWAIWYAHNKEQQRQAVWRGLALDRGGTFLEPAGSWWKRSSHAVEVEVDGSGVRLDTFTVGSGKNQKTYTRARAALAIAAGPRFRVYREGFFSSMGKALGTQDVVLGNDRAFDDEFMVKCDDAEATRAMWSQTAMGLMLQRFSRGRCECDTTAVELTILGACAERAILDDMIDLAAALAGADIFGLSALANLSGGRYQASHGSWDRRSAPRVDLDLPTRVTIEPALVDGHARTRARAPRGRSGDEISVTIDHGTFASELPVELPADAAKLCQNIGAGELTLSGDRASFTWLGIETDAERLTAGARLLASLQSGPAQGVFR